MAKRTPTLAAVAAVSMLALGGPGVPEPAAQEGVRPDLTITWQARALQPGEVVLLTIEAAGPLASVEGRAFGQPIAAFPTDDPATWQALAGIDVETTAGSSPVTVEARTADGRRQTGTRRLAVASRRFGTRRLKVAPEFVTPPESARPRIAREQARLAALLSVVSRPRLWHDTFVPPADGAPASNFGLLSVFNGVPRSRHRGTDFASPSGAPVRAPNAGRVVLAGDLYYSGNTVLLDHGCGLFSLLAHLSRIDVAVGDLVETGAKVGAVGATGRVTGPHLHWTLRIGAAAVDPLSLLALLGGGHARP